MYRKNDKHNCNGNTQLFYEKRNDISGNFILVYFLWLTYML